MKSREDLKAIRERAKAALAVRDGGDRTRVVVAMGTCGIAAGAREVMSALLDELAARGLASIAVSQTGCKGLCDAEPMVEIHQPGAPVVTYGRVTPEIMRCVVAEHLVEGRVVEAHIVASRSEAN